MPGNSTMDELYLESASVVISFLLLGRWLRADRHRLLLAAVAGALAFDGVAIGFFPEVYGQPQESMAWVAATLLWAFAWIVIAEAVVEARTTR